MKGLKIVLITGIVFLPILLFAQIPSFSRYCAIPSDLPGATLAGVPEVNGTDFWATSGINTIWYTNSCAIRVQGVTNHHWNDLWYAGSFSSSYNTYYYLHSAGKYTSGDNIYAAVSIGFRRYSYSSTTNYYYEGFGYVYGSEQPFPTNDKRGMAVWHYGTLTNTTDARHNGWCAYQDLDNSKTFLTFSTGTSSSYWFTFEMGSSNLEVTDMVGVKGTIWGPVFITGYDTTTGDGFLRGYYGFNGATYSIRSDSSIVVPDTKLWAVRLVRDMRDGEYYLFVAAGSEGLLIYRVISDIYAGNDYSAGFTSEPIAQWNPEGETLNIRDVYVYRTDDGNYWALLTNYDSESSAPMIIGLDWYNLRAINEWARIEGEGKMGKRLWVSESARRIAIITDKEEE